ncbi:MAG TPA: glutaredoxin family protein [Pseudomonadales bacterium]|nr:glutaredoxin family protein [Pseudomonadales bacterium]
MPTLYVYSTLGCHLCEVAAALLEESPLVQQWQLCYQEIADDPQLMNLYGVRIPVLKRDDSQAELNWPFDAGDLQRFLASPAF